MILSISRHPRLSAAMLSSCLMLFLSTASADMISRHVDPAMRSLQRTGTTVTTAACEKVRLEPFVAKLELEYFYLVESLGGPLESLTGMKNAIVRSILDALHRCDQNGFPQYALDLTTPQVYAEQGYCIPQNPDNACSVIKGRTEIYLDGGVNEARDIAYTAITQALQDPSFVVLFEPNVVHSRFLNSTQETLVLVNDDADPTPPAVQRGTSLVAVGAISASAIVAVIALIFSYGFFRRQTKRNNELRAQQQELEQQQRRRQKKHRRQRPLYFFPLDEEAGMHSAVEEGPVVHITGNEDDGRSATWSVSDMTSDSGSVQSMFSRTTSRLEKIEEEEEVAEVVEDLNTDFADFDNVEAQDYGPVKKKDPLRLTEYTVAYAAHKSRLQDILMQACNESDDEDGKQTTPKTEESFATLSFGSLDDSDGPDVNVSDESVQDHSDLLPNMKDPSELDEYYSPQPDNGYGETRESLEVTTADETPLLGLNHTNNSPRLLDMSMDWSVVSEASLKGWLTRLLAELHSSQYVKRIES